MKTININLKIPNYAYLFGFIQTDDHLYPSTRDRSRLSIEVSKIDEDILWAFKSLIPFNSSITDRVRVTNFSNRHTSVIWRVYDKRFRDYLESWGLPSGSRSWTPKEDRFITTHSVECSMKVLGRSRNSVKLRLWRLKKLGKQLVTN
ncbi:MAG: hypothetical protein AB1589_30810 [Cyanobacteriota bacterium]